MKLYFIRYGQSKRDLELNLMIDVEIGDIIVVQLNKLGFWFNKVKIYKMRCIELKNVVYHIVLFFREAQSNILVGNLEFALERGENLMNLDLMVIKFYRKYFVQMIIEFLGLKIICFKFFNLQNVGLSQIYVEDEKAENFSVLGFNYLIFEEIEKNKNLNRFLEI